MRTVDEDFIAQNAFELEAEIFIELDVTDICVEGVDVNLFESKCLDAILDP